MGYTVLQVVCTSIQGIKILRFHMTSWNVLSNEVETAVNPRVDMATEHKSHLKNVVRRALNVDIEVEEPQLKDHCQLCYY